MPVVFTLLAGALYLAPVALFVALRSRRDRPLWGVALDVPVAIAIDLLAMLALSRAMRLEAAVFASRAAWLVGTAAVLAWRVRRGDRPRWPRALRPRDLVAAAAAGALAVALSMAVSRHCHIWDRAWHIPLVSSLRGQRLPFHNVYQPDVRLEYHYTGDVAAAALQSLSFARMHSSLALSLAHDIHFGLFALTAALLLRALGLRSVLLTIVGSLAPLLSGPMSVLFQGAKRTYRGYSFLNFYVLSFRPHFPLGALFVLAFAGAALVALRERQRPAGWATAGVMVACTAALTLTDEASTGVLGLGLGAAWLVAPRVAHPRRAQGVAVFGALLAAVVLPQLLFAGTLAPGSLRQHVVWVPWRSPGYYTPPLPLAGHAGLWALVRDVLPLALLGAAALVTLLEARRREQFAVVACLMAVLVASLVLLCRIEVRADLPVLPSGGFAGQNHRFMTAALLVTPLLSAGALVDRSPLQPRRMVALSAVALAVASVALSSASTLEWLHVQGNGAWCAAPSRYGSRDDFFRVDCRRDVAARLGAKTQPAYGDFSVVYMYAGCHPTYLAGPKVLTYRVKIGLAVVGVEGLRQAASFLPPQESLRIVCPAHGTTKDVVCKQARDLGTCRPLGSKTVACTMSAEQRNQLLAPTHGPGDESPDVGPDTP